MKPVACLVGLLCSLYCAGAIADAPSRALFELDLDELTQVKLATGNWKPVTKAPAVTTVITARDIAASGARDLSEVLETVPGLHVVPGIVGSPRFFIRGITSTYNPQTLLLVDGVPINGIYLGYRNGFWAGMPVQAISRIEVMRSPGSALYGADAFAGVVNIITKTEELYNPEMGAGVASYNTRDAVVQFGKRTTNGGYGFSLEWLKTDGPDERIDADAQTAWDQLAELLNLPVPAVSLAPGRPNYQRELLELRSFWQQDYFSLRFGIQDRDNLGTGAGIADALQPSGTFASTRYLLLAQLQQLPLAEHWLLDVDASYYQQDQRPLQRVVIFPAGAFFGAFPDGFIGEPYYREVNQRLETRAHYDGIAQQHWLIGVGATRAGLPTVRETKNFDSQFNPFPGGITDVSDTDEVYLPEKWRQSRYLFLQQEWAFNENWELTLGLRHDDYSDVGQSTNPRAALVWSANQRWVFKLLYGEAFRAPGFFVLYSRNNPTSIGNPDLKPETIATTEWVANWAASESWRLNLSLFHYQANDFISVDPTDAINKNRGDRHGYGAELEAQYNSFEDWRWFAHLAYQNSVDEQTDAAPGFAPDWEFWQRLEWQLSDNWLVSTQWNHVSRRQREASDPRPDLDSYDAIDLALHWQPSPQNLRLSLRISNLLDDDIREPSTGPSGPFNFITLPDDLPMPKRNFSLDLIYRY